MGCPHQQAPPGGPISRPEGRAESRVRGRAGHSSIAATQPLVKPPVQVEHPERSEDEPGGAARRQPYSAARKAPKGPQREPTLRPGLRPEGVALARPVASSGPMSKPSKTPPAAGAGRRPSDEDGSAYRWLRAGSHRDQVGVPARPPPAPSPHTATCGCGCGYGFTPAKAMPPCWKRWGRLAAFRHAKRTRPSLGFAQRLLAPASEYSVLARRAHYRRALQLPLIGNQRYQNLLNARRDTCAA
jgi:hypothetical protein